jgi:hypothetical protein
MVAKKNATKKAAAANPAAKKKVCAVQRVAGLTALVT